MESCQQHYNKYINNADFLKLPELEENFKEWYVTGAFYCSLHLIEGYLWKFKSKSTSNHKERYDLVKSDSVLRRIFMSYSLLYHESLRARYYDKVFSSDDIDQIKDSLNDIESKLCNLVSTNH